MTREASRRVESPVGHGPPSAGSDGAGDPAQEATVLDDLAILVPEVYGELRRLAEMELRSERREHTLQATALVHEAYLRIARHSQKNRTTWKDPRQFRALADHTIRRVLIDHARCRRTARRGRSWNRVTLTDDVALLDRPMVDFLALDEALRGLASAYPRKARLVELRFFGGLTLPECAQELGLSTRAAAGDWAFARAWLRRELCEGEPATSESEPSDRGDGT